MEGRGRNGERARPRRDGLHHVLPAGAVHERRVGAGYGCVRCGELERSRGVEREIGSGRKCSSEIPRFYARKVAAEKRIVDLMATPAAALETGAPRRNVAVDAYRGFVMLLMMGEVLSFSEVAHAYPNSLFWKFLSYHQSHVEWAGCSLHDTIQPGFSFLVGVALPYSIASRVAKGKSFGNQLGHAIWRSLILILLGFFLRSHGHTMTYFTFEDTLTQIGLGYVFLFLLGFAKEKWQWISLAAILFGYWLAWALYPAAGAGFDWQSVGVP